MSNKLFICNIFIAIGSCIFLLLIFFVYLPVIIDLAKVGLVVGGTGTLTIFGLTKCLGKERTEAIIKNLVLLGAIVVIILIIGEFTVRFVFRDITTTGDNTSYFAKRWKNGNVRLNRWKFREREFELKKPEAVYRIAVIGDSFTFGQGVAENDRFTNLLQKSLNENNGYEILNFGKPGAETIDHIEILKDVVLKTNPDFILLQWFVNDFEGRDKSGRPKVIMNLMPLDALSNMLHGHSALYYLINKQWGSLQRALGFSGSYVEYMFKRFGDPVSPDSIEYNNTLKHFIKLCKNREIPLGIVLFPQLGSNLGKGYPLDYLHDRVIEIFTNEKITCIDLRSTFAKFSKNRKLWVNRFDGHPGPIANHLAAEKLMDTFSHIWLSESASE